MADHNILGAPSLDLDDSDILTGYTSAPFELEELEEMLKTIPRMKCFLILQLSSITPPVLWTELWTATSV